MRSAASRVGVAVGLTALLAVVPSFDRQSRVWAQSPSEKPLSRLDRLDLWLDAVNRHEFGSPDRAVETVNAWSSSELRTLWIDISSIVTLVRDRKMRQFFMPVDRELRWTQQGWVTAQNRMVQVFYTGRELTHLLEIATSFGEPTSGRENLLLKRGAALSQCWRQRRAGRRGGPLQGRSAIGST